MACCPMYFTVSLVLAFLAISTAVNSLHKNKSSPQIIHTVHPLSLNASRALKRSGFSIMATIFQISPEIFLSSSSPNTTIFAIQDSTLYNTTLPPWILKNLLQYHTSPLKLSFNDLLKKPKGVCIPTILQGKNVAVTKVNATQKVVEINRVVVTHPDIFLEGPFSIQGVEGSFSSLDPRNVIHGLDYIESPVCDLNFKLVVDLNQGSNDTIEWTRIIRLLSSNGFVSFSVGLHSALDEILGDHMNLSSVTIFAPFDFPFVAETSSFLLDKIVRRHILPQRLTFAELASYLDYESSSALLGTMVRDHDLEIRGDNNSSRGITVNGVDIVAPDLFTSKKFVIHAISQAFEIPKDHTIPM